MISRKTLLQKLDLVKPALADNEMYLVLTYYCFDGRRAIACNDRIAISTPCTSEFKGCVPGTVLTDVLEAARHAAVKLLADGEHAVVKLGNAQVALPMLPVDDFLDDSARRPYPPPLGQLCASGLPDMLLTQNCIRGIAGKFFAAVEHCLQSVEINSTAPDKLGITAIPERDKLQLYSTNSITISRATVPLPPDSGIKQRVILSPEFCRGMLRLAKQAQTTRLAVKVMKVRVNGGSVLKFNKGRITRVTHRTVIAKGGYVLFAADDTLLFGKLIASERPVDYVSAFNRRLPQEYSKHLVPIPHRRLGGLLKGVSCISHVVGNEPYTDLSIKDGEARFYGRSKRGEVSDAVRLPGHPDIELKVHISQVFKGYSAFKPEKILFGERTVVLARGEHLHLVATSGAHEASSRELTVVQDDAGTGLWLVMDDTQVLVRFKTNAEAWRFVDRYEGEPVSRSDAPPTGDGDRNEGPKRTEARSWTRRN